MNILLGIAFFSAVILMVSVIIGYFFCYAFYAPWLLHKNKRKKISNMLINPIAGFSIERDLKELATDTGCKAATNTIKIITICKYSIIINLLIFFGLFAIIKLNT